MLYTKAKFFILLFFFLAKNFFDEVGAEEEFESITKYSPNQDLNESTWGDLNKTGNATLFLVQEDIEYGYEEDKSSEKDNVASPYPRALEEITANDIFTAVDSALTDSPSQKDTTENSTKPVYSVGELKDLVARLENKTDEASAGAVEQKMDEIVFKLNNSTHQNLELNDDDLLEYADDDEEEEEDNESFVKDASVAQDALVGQEELKNDETQSRLLKDYGERKLNKKGMKKMLRCRGADGKNGMGKCQQQVPAQIVAPQPAALIPAPLVTALYSAPTQPTVPPAMLQNHLSPVHMY